jgi:beta-carotene/zeaxanthin 4-ketolase
MSSLPALVTLSQRVIPDQPTKFSSLGIVIAFLVMLLWSISLVALLNLNVREVSKIGVLSLILWQAFLYTGLFITAHDAMHGSVCPQCRALNHWIGTVALVLYSFLAYSKLRSAHHQHHCYPASRLDPDFHDGHHQHWLVWYLRFMWTYRSLLSWMALVLSYYGSLYVLSIPQANLLLFWAIPSLLSSFQLFYFGTYLPHREPRGGYQTPWRAVSQYRPYLWSLITCYHFGYHQEHHQYPYIPWWRLPNFRHSLMQEKTTLRAPSLHDQR